MPLFLIPALLKVRHSPATTTTPTTTTTTPTRTGIPEKFGKIYLRRFNFSTYVNANRITYVLGQKWTTQ